MKVTRLGKKQGVPTPDVLAYIKYLEDVPEDELAGALERIDKWRWSRHDLLYWVTVLDRLDAVLERIVTEYELDKKLQVKNFDDQTRRLLVAVISFQYLLLDSCINKRVFASYDRFYHLLLTNDLDILRMVIYCTYRSSQQYLNRTPFEPGLMPKFAERMLALSKGWERLLGSGLSLVDIVTASEYTPPSDPVSITFYPDKAQAGPSNSPDTSITVDLSVIDPAHSVQQLSQIAEEKHMPLHDQLLALTKLRLGHMTDLKTRQQMLTIRCLAYSVYVHLTDEKVVDANVFLYEPEFVKHLAEVTEAKTDDFTRAAALLALDASFRMKSQTPEVVQSMSFGVSHGPLLNLLRSISTDSELPDFFVDALFSFMGTIVRNEGYVTLLLGAGALTVLLDALALESADRYNYIPRLCGLIEALTYVPVQGLTTLTNADGANTYVRRIREELAREPPSPPDINPPAFDAESLAQYYWGPLRAVLRQAYRLMHNTGGFEGLRNLVDTDLPTSIKTIIENRDKYGVKAYQVAISAMAAFIHNEPTSLSILQEQGLPLALYRSLSESCPASFDVINAIPNAIGAICLNNDGMALTKANLGVIRNMIQAALDVDSRDELAKEYLLQLGAMIDELIRHHPSLRQDVLTLMMDMVDNAIEEGLKDEPTEENRTQCDLFNISAKPDFKENLPPVLIKLGKLCGLVAALLHVSAVATAFVSGKGVEKLLRICDCPTVPLTFAPSPSTPIGTVFKALGDKERDRVASQFALSINEALDACAQLWDKEAGHDVVAAWEAIRDKKDQSPETQRAVRAFLAVGYRLEFLNVAFSLQVYRDWDGFVTVVRSLRETNGFLDRAGKFYLSIFDVMAHLKHWDYSSSPPTTFNNPANFTIERVCIAANKFNQGLLGMMDNKRTIQPAQRIEVDTLATHMAKLLAALVSTATESEGDTPISRLTTVLVQVHSMLLEGPGLGNVAAVMVLAAFIQQGHMPALLNVFSRIIDFYDKMPADVFCAIKEAKPEKKHLEGPIGSLLVVLASLVQSRTYLLSPWAAHLGKTDPSFSIHKLLLRVRHAIFPLLRRIWTSPWLTDLGATAVRTEILGYKAVLEAKDEEEPPKPQPVIQQQSVARTAEAILNQIAPALNIPTVVTPNPTRVALLVEMGFTQGAAERALIRARNSVTNATEMLITEPHLFADAEPAAPAPAPAADVAATSTETPADSDAAPAGTDSAQHPADGSTSAERSTTADNMDTDEAAESNPAPASAPMETDEPPQPDPSEWAIELKDEPERDYLKELNAEREQAKVHLSDRTVEIVDRNSDLATALFPILPAEEGTISYLLDKLSEVAEEYDDSRETVVHARMRFMVVVMGALKVGLDDLAVAKALTVLSSLDMTRFPRPKWLSGAMLLTQAVLLSPPLVTPAKIGDEPSSTVTESSDFDELEQQYFDACISIISAGTPVHEGELASAYRGLVLLTRRSDRAFTFIKNMLGTFRSTESKAEGLQCLLAMIFRHAFEDERTVADILRRQIDHLKPPSDSPKVLELKDFVDTLEPLAMRDPSQFVGLVEKNFSLILPKTQAGRYQLKPKPESSGKNAGKGNDAAAGSAAGDVAMSDPFRETPANPSAKAVIELLLSELKSVLTVEETAPTADTSSKVETLPAVAEEKKEEDGKTAEDADKAKAEEAAKAEAKVDHAHSYLSLILGLLTELVGSYMPAKQIFLAACRATGTFGPGKAGIAGLITGLGCSANLVQLSTAAKSRNTEVKRVIDKQHWAQSLVVALCADLSPLRDMKDINEDLVSVRKTVIDAVVKAIRDGYSVPNLDARYSRLWQMADLLHELLPASSSPPVSKDESRTHMARVMIEKNCVSALTIAVGDADLNYPNVGGAGIAVLRALDDLTKIATKWGKIDKTKAASSTQAQVDASSTRPEIDEGESDMEMDEEDEDDGDENDEDNEMPDLYRHSALQRLENEPDDEDSDDEEGEGDDEDEDGAMYDDMMDYDVDDMDAMAETDPSGDEDDEDEDMDEGDWTDEEEGDEDDDEDGSENPDDVHPEIVIGDDASYDVDGLDWDGPPPTAEDMRRIFENDLENEEQYDDEEPDPWDEDDHHDDMFDGYDELDMEFEDYDGDEDLDEDGYRSDDYRESSRPNEGPWGWYGGSNSRGSASSRAYDEASAFFGFGDPAESGQGVVPSHPLVRSQARLANFVNGSHRHITTEDFFNIAMHGEIPGLSSLIQRHVRERGHQQLRMSIDAGADGSVTYGFGNRTFHVTPDQVQRAFVVTAAALSAADSANPAIGSGIGSAAGAAGAPPAKLTIFGPEQTIHRWDAEFKGVIGGDATKLNTRLVAHIVNRLEPAARKAAEEEEKKQKAEEEALAKEKEEKDEARRQEAAEALLAASQTVLPESRVSPPPPAVAPANTEAESAAAPVAAASEDVEMTSPAFQPASTLPVIVGEAESSTTTPPVSQQPQVGTLRPRAYDEVSMRSAQVDAGAPDSDAAPASASAQADSAGSSASAAATETAAASTADRTIIQIHGRDVDITDTGIDLEFLQALPEDMRADVVEQYLREHGVISSPDLDGTDDEGAADGFNDEFLAALPAHLRREILMQQAQELGGRQSAAASAQPAQAAGAAASAPAAAAAPATAPQAAPAAILPSTAGGTAAGALPVAVIPLSGASASLSTAANRAVIEQLIREQMGNVSAQISDLVESLPAAEGSWEQAMAIVNDTLAQRFPGAFGQGVRRILAESAAAAKRARDPSRKEREVIQLLDKNGIACLVRLLFVPDFFKKGHLYNIFNNLCQNSTTRSDLLNLLISVVQDGSGDLPAVDRSFQQMSLKAPGAGATPGGPAHAAVAFQTPKNTPRGRVAGATETPLPPSSAAMTQVASPLLAQLPADSIPAFVTGRCLAALDEIVKRDSKTIDFFLTEHEQPVGLKKVAASAKGKGKGKEKEKDKTIPQTKFPIVILLGLLERPVLLNTTGLLDAYTALLVKITKPLSSLKAKDAAALKKEEEQAQGSQGQEAGAAAGTTSTSAQPAAAGAEPTAPASAPVGLATPRAVMTTSSAGFLEGLFTPAAPINTTVDPPTASRSETPARTPVIPAPVIRLIANCLTGKECTRTSFHNALQVMQNLINLPEGKDVILAELGARAQALGAVVHEELAALFAATQAEDASAADTVMLDKFAPSWASQAQLLRLLKAIEWLYTKKYDFAEFSPDELSPEQKVVGEVFNSFGFDPIWRQLGDCLTAIEQKGSKDDGATLLLPLIEALMIICRYRGRGEGRSPSAPAASVPPTPAAGAAPQQIDWSSADLFTVFTTAHRKYLNAIVRNTPSLLSGSFSLLIRNPRVLEFDNKRNWFMQTLKKQRDLHNSPSLHLNVRRQYVFEDSFQTLQRRTGDEIKYGKLHVKFVHEDGVDAGGVTREWYSVLSKQIFDPNFVLFEPCAADAQTYQPNKHSSVNGEHLAYYKFVGRIIGKAVYDGRLLDAYFSRAFYKQILGKTVDMRDLESVDPEYHKSLQWILENPVEGVVDLEFAVEDEEFGAKKIVPLKEGGEKIPVTDQNKQEYVQLVVSYRLENSIKDQMKAFLTGFFDIIPKQLIQIFEPDQLELLISGLTTIDVDELKNATQMVGWKPTDPEVGWFWRALRSFSQEERARFLMFVTSSSRVPLGGFTQLQGASGIQPFQLQKLYAPNGSLPQAATCFNQLLLPKYDSYEHLRERLVFAVTETSGFGKA